MSELANGQALAAVACAQCHTPPSPSFLSRDEWPYVLAWMGNYLGYPAEIEFHALVVDKGLVPPQPVVTREQFDAIRSYYLEQASVQYAQPAPVPKPPVSPLFDPLPFTIPAGVITMAEIDPSDQTLLIGSSRPAGLLLLERGRTTRIEVHSEPVMFERIGQLRRVALMGHFGRDHRLGRIVDFDLRDGVQQALVDAHPRITAHRTADVDGDGHDDLFVCGFGDYPAGRVGICWGGGESLQEEVLFEEPGATWGDVADFDGDGDRDIVIAVANARPRLLAFVNEGRRHLTPRMIVERPVGWGYNRCVLVDWDGDAKPDIVELAGNNLELRGRPIKTHYGVRVLRNESQWRFREVLFERLDGAMDVAAGDFDGNGRTDLAATAFYPDWRLPIPTTVLLLMQRTDGTVERAGIDDRYWNRWLRVSAGDADGDGGADLLLGAAQVPMAIPSEYATRYEQLLQGKASVLLLRNRTASG
ncbi:MAG: VCBS repeat-containing protein, partial [Verrucomicrobiales bacterium]|nr:VCBS repeat-containing protein [Verrucomicrobiales bacterium]